MAKGIGRIPAAEQEIGRLPDFDRGLDLDLAIIVRGEVELDLLAGFLLEGGDDLPDRLVLLVVVALLPPHDEVGGTGAEGHQG